MDWTTLLADLKARGWTQQQIADEVGASQATISDLRRGVTTEPGYGIGRALEQLHESGKERTGNTTPGALDEAAA